MMDSDVTLLPQPDSPTRPRVSPGIRSNDRPSTASTSGRESPTVRKVKEASPPAAQAMATAHWISSAAPVKTCSAREFDSRDRAQPTTRAQAAGKRTVRIMSRVMGYPSLANG